MDVSLRQLRTFLAVADAGHFSVAAERVHLTQPAVSRHVAQLEAALGVRLLDRTTRAVDLTPAGTRVRDRVARILDELDATLADTRTESEGLRGTVRVAAGPTPSAELMPQAIARCARDYPEISLRSRDRVQEEVLQAIRTASVDFGVVIDPPRSRELIAEPLLDDAFVVVCRRGHRFAQRPRIRWIQLRGEPLVLLDHSSGSRRAIDGALARHRVDARVAQETGYPHTAYRMVEAGLGCSIMPGLSAPTSLKLVARPLVPRVQRAVALVRLRNHSLTPAAERVRTVLIECAAERQPHA